MNDHFSYAIKLIDKQGKHASICKIKIIVLNFGAKLCGGKSD